MTQLTKKKRKTKRRARTPKKPAETFPTAIFVIHDGDGEEQVMLVEETIDGISEPGKLVATYYLQNVRQLIIGKHLE